VVLGGYENHKKWMTWWESILRSSFEIDNRVDLLTEHLIGPSIYSKAPQFNSDWK